MLRLAGRLLDTRATVYAACAVSLGLGLFFIFVWSPLPWGWKGLDDYYDIARSLARGEAFATLDVMWGYAYFLAFWYRVFGDHPSVPLCVQALLNATIPLLLYYLVQPALGQRVAVMSAVLAALFSFNTVYASTQAADAVCTVVVVAAMLCVARGDARDRIASFAAAGLLIGVAYQLRPNLILFPAFVAVAYVQLPPRSRVKFARMAVFLGLFAAAATPWVIRNYRWSGLFIPASTHGGGQLWSGTLQSGDYEDSWVYNPRAAFEHAPLDYTSIDELPVIISASLNACDASARPRVDLVYWTNRDRAPARLRAWPIPNRVVTFELPKQPSPTAIYYYFELDGVAYGERRRGRTPRAGAGGPLMTVISRDHLGDLDIDGSVLDVFDVARMVRHVAWHEPLPFAQSLDLDRDGSVTDGDVRAGIALLVHEHAALADAEDEVVGIDRGDAAVTLHLRDGSAIAIPRQSSNVITDLTLQTVGARSMAAALVSRSRPFVALQPAHDADSGGECLMMTDIGVNTVPYRRLPHDQRRYMALALDNIRHAPVAYLEGSARRALRVFVIMGSPDPATAHQFNRAVVIYGVGRAVSIGAFVLLVVGVGIAIARRAPVFMLIVPIVYVPLTICFMLINARYSMTTQPFAFAFVALTLVTVMEALTPDARRPAARAPR